MSILIKGMEMPSENDSIHILKDGTVVVYRTDSIDFYTAIPVPEHGDLIDRDKLEKDIDNYIGGEESRSRFHHWVQVQSVVIPGNKGEQT